MPSYICTLPEDSRLEARQLWRLGTFERGEPRTLELSQDQVKSLKARGIEVRRKPAPRATVEPEPAPEE